MTTFDKIVKYTTPLLFATLILYIIYLSVYPLKSIDIYNQPIHTEKYKYAIGEAVVYQFNYCRFTSTIPRVIRNIVPLEGDEFEIPIDGSLIDQKYVHEVGRTLLTSFDGSGLKSEDCSRESPLSLTDDFIITPGKFSQCGRYTMESVLKYKHSLFHEDRSVVYFEPFYVCNEEE